MKSVNQEDEEAVKIDKFSQSLREKSFTKKSVLEAGDRAIFNPNIFKQSKRVNILRSVQQFLNLPKELRILDEEMIKTTIRKREFSSFFITLNNFICKCSPKNRALQVYDCIASLTLEIQRKIVLSAYLENYAPGRILIQGRI